MGTSSKKPRLYRFDVLTPMRVKVSRRDDTIERPREPTTRRNRLAPRTLPLRLGDSTERHDRCASSHPEDVNVEENPIVLLGSRTRVRRSLLRAGDLERLCRNSRPVPSREALSPRLPACGALPRASAFFPSPLREGLRLRAVSALDLPARCVRSGAVLPAGAVLRAVMSEPD